VVAVENPLCRFSKMRRAGALPVHGIVSVHTDGITNSGKRCPNFHLLTGHYRGGTLS